MTLPPAVLLMIIGGTVRNESAGAGVGMFVGGFVLALAALFILGPSSYQLDVEGGRVLIVSRYCLVRARAACRLYAG